MKSAPRMPVLFVGHGSPMNAITDNVFTRGFRRIAEAVPRPHAIVAISAHWYVDGTYLTGDAHPRTIHDFGGFPRALYEIEYPARGAPEVAKAIRDRLGGAVALRSDWGLDHGTWSVLEWMYPAADVPVIQLSIDRRLPPARHLEIGRALRPLRRRIQMVFQDPFGSLNPRATVGATLTEALAFHRVVPRDERRARAAELLELVGLSDRLFDRLPHELSGGQRQRVGIARALSVEPTLVVQDEPVSALDVSVRAQLLVLLGALRTELALTYLFISHDLSVVESFCDRVLVMYLGRVVEALPVEDLAARARHPYTKALLAAVPSMDPRARRRTPRAALDSPSPLDVPSGCAYRTRCELAEPSCSEQRPTLVRIAEAHHVACPVVR